MMERIYMTDEPDCYFLPSESRVFRRDYREFPWSEELYVTRHLSYVLHVFSEDGKLDKWYRISQQDAMLWFRRAGIKAEFEI